jgi:hypothetical protein
MHTRQGGLLWVAIFDVHAGVVGGGMPDLGNERYRGRSANFILDCFGVGVGRRTPVAAYSSACLLLGVM